MTFFQHDAWNILQTKFLCRPNHRIIGCVQNTGIRDGIREKSPGSNLESPVPHVIEHWPKTGRDKGGRVDRSPMILSLAFYVKKKVLELQ